MVSGGRDRGAGLEVLQWSMMICRTRQMPQNRRFERHKTPVDDTATTPMSMRSAHSMPAPHVSFSLRHKQIVKLLLLVEA